MATKKTATKKTKTASQSRAAGQDSTKAAKTPRTTSRQASSAAAAEKKKPAAKPRKSAAASKGQEQTVEGSPATILARAEEDMTRLLDSLNNQMSAAMHAFEELAAIHRGQGAVVTRTRPIDRATAMFQRLVSEVIDDRFAEVLPTLVALRVEMGQRAQAASQDGPDGQDAGSSEFFTRGSEMLDQVLSTAEVQPYEPKIGDAYDPLIHLAIGETDRADLAGDVVSEVFQNGFRTVRGKVIQPARVKVNRR